MSDPQTQTQLYDISFYSLGVFNSKISAVEHEDIYNSIPQFVFQNKGWIIKSMEYIKTRLPHLSENETIQIAYNYQSPMYILISKHRSDQVCILMPDSVRNNPVTHRLAKTETTCSKASLSAQTASLVPLPASDDDQDYPETKGKQTSPNMLCLENIFRLFKRGVYYLTEFFGLNRPA
jgi:hypothetical protein